MPGFSGTGPNGQGPLTGRGMGYCSTGNPVRPRFGYSPGSGGGYARGFGRGRLWCGIGRTYGKVIRLAGGPTDNSNLQEYADFLKDELNLLKGKLQRIEEMLSLRPRKKEE